MKELRNFRILVVDDEKDLLEAICFELESEEALVQKASNGNEALELIKKNDFDLIISDVKMPNGNGIFLTEQIKNKNPVVPNVVLISGFSDLTIDQAYHKGVVGIIAKPFDPSHFINLVKRATLPHSKMWSDSVLMGKDFFETKIFGSNLEEMAEKKKFSLGRGGLFIPMSKSFPVVGSGVKIKFDFDSEKSKSFECIGVVRWMRETAKENLAPGIGVEFSGLSSEAIECFERMIQKMPELVAFIPQSF